MIHFAVHLVSPYELSTNRIEFCCEADTDIAPIIAALELGGYSMTSCDIADASELAKLASERAQIHQELSAHCAIQNKELADLLEKQKQENAQGWDRFQELNQKNKALWQPYIDVILD